MTRMKIDEVIAVIEAVRTRHPLVHCLTNQVVKAFTANVLLAAGAAPAMIEHPEEAAEFAPAADALLINLGTLDEPQMLAMRQAIPAAVEVGRPWVLDPVAVGLLTVRTRFAREILAHQPTVIRGNASEILALAGENGLGRGVDSGTESATARTAARSLAMHSGSTVLVTGRIDFVIDPSSETSIANGHPLMTRVTGVGCAMGALTAACLAVSDSPPLGAVASAVFLGLAGELAAKAAQHPGTFQIALLDALDTLTSDDIRQQARISTGEPEIIKEL